LKRIAVEVELVVGSIPVVSTLEIVVMKPMVEAVTVVVAVEVAVGANAV